MKTCLECGRPMFYSDPDGACFPCALDELRRQDRVSELGQIAAPGYKYYHALHANIQTAVEERRHG